MTGIVEIIIILVLILLNGYLALAEIAVVSARKARLQQQSDLGNQGAKAALELVVAPSEFLSTVQVGITLVGVLAGAFGGATLAEQIEVWLLKIPAIAAYSELISVLLVVLAITYLTLILGELVPKRLALNNPEKVAAAVGRTMKLIARMFTPVIKFLTFSTDIVLKLLRAYPPDEPPVTEEEIKFMIQAGTDAGVFEESEQDMVGRIFRLSDWRVGTLITPRMDIEWIDIEDDTGSILEKVKLSAHTLLPVARGSIDNVLGVLRAKDLLVASLDGNLDDIDRLISEPLLVPESMPAFQVLEKLQNTRLRMALVIDEFGGLQGLVTLFDLFEAIAGEFPYKDEINSNEIVRREDGSWLVDGMLSIDEFKEYFRIDSLPDEGPADYQTVGGFMMTFLGHIPKVSEQFTWDKFQFEIIDMDGLRVDKILVRLNTTNGT